MINMQVKYPASELKLILFLFCKFIRKLIQVQWQSGFKY